jgi:hypothetical protein
MGAHHLFRLVHPNDAAKQAETNAARAKAAGGMGEDGDADAAPATPMDWAAAQRELVEREVTAAQKAAAGGLLIRITRPTLN